MKHYLLNYYLYIYFNIINILYLFLFYTYIHYYCNFFSALLKCYVNAMLRTYDVPMKYKAVFYIPKTKGTG